MFHEKCTCVVLVLGPTYKDFNFFNLVLQDRDSKAHEVKIGRLLRPATSRLVFCQKWIELRAATDLSTLHL